MNRVLKLLCSSIKVYLSIIFPIFLHGGVLESRDLSITTLDRNAKKDYEMGIAVRSKLPTVGVVQLCI